MPSTQWDEILAARLLLSSNGHEPGTKNEMNGGRKGRGPHDERRADRTAFFSTRLRYDTQLVCHSFFLRKRITTPLQALSFSFCRDLFFFGGESWPPASAFDIIGIIYRRGSKLFVASWRSFRDFRRGLRSRRSKEWGTPWWRVLGCNRVPLEGLREESECIPF